MTPEPRTQADYVGRETEAARRVLIDLGQVLGSCFKDSVVVVGGWVPDLLLPDAEEPHVGSVDVDLALDTEKLREGKYAEIVKSILATGRYEKTDRAFRLEARVDLRDGGAPVLVAVDFLKPKETRRRRKGPTRLPGFRPLDADGCAAAFQHPLKKDIEGLTIAGAENRVHLLVASIADFLIMKSYALTGRDKPKDAYDICYCLDHAPEGIEGLAADWRARVGDPLVVGAIGHLREKFKSLKSFGPKQVAEFYDPATVEERELRERRAFELVGEFLRRVDKRKRSS